MNLSLNEIEALCKKAARGAGISWGLAEGPPRPLFRWLSAQRHGRASIAGRAIASQ